MLALAACAPKASKDADDYAVWSAAIRALGTPAKKPVIVDAHTSSDELRENPIQLSWWMQRDYNQRNRIRAVIDPARLSVPGVRVLPDDSASVAARHGAGVMVHDPWISLTRPGFSLTRREAVVTITSSCRGLCGGGETMVLVRGDDGRWRKEATISTIVF